MPPSDGYDAKFFRDVGIPEGTFSNEFPKRDLEKRIEELKAAMLEQMARVTPLVIHPDPRPIVPKWLYDQMGLMDDG